MKNQFKSVHAKSVLLSLAISILSMACSSQEQQTKSDSNTEIGSLDAAQQGSITTVYHNAKVYTVDANDSWAQSFAVENGKIVAVGSNADVLATVGENSNQESS